MAVTTAELGLVAAVEVMETHVNCRCTMVPITKSYAELLDDPTFEDDRPHRDTGPEAFARLAPDIQQEILGPGKYALYKRGLPLEAMWRSVSHPEWGTSRVGKSLKQLRDEIASGMWGELKPVKLPSTDPRRDLYEGVREYIERASFPSAIAKRFWDKLEASGVSREEGLRLLQATIDNGTFQTRRSYKTALRIIEEGRFRSQFETGTSAGFLGPGTRSRAETAMFGYPTNLPAEQRPIYGYVLPAGDDEFKYEGGSSNTTSYGGVRFQLRSGIRDTTTVVWDDSLNSALLPSPATAVGERSYRSAIIALNENQPGYPYIEAQYHGGLKLDDVEKVAFVWEQGYENAASASDLREALTQAGFVYESSNPSLEYEVWTRP